MIDLRPLSIDIENQARGNSCVFQSFTSFCEAVILKFTKQRVELSPAFGWYLTRKAGGHQNDNVGVIPEVALNIMKKNGCCTEATFPYSDTNINTEPPANAFVEAKRYKIGKWVALKTEAEIDAYLTKGLPVLFCMQCPDGMVQIHGPESTHPEQWQRIRGNKHLGGHMMTIYGKVDDNYIVVNSWGLNWGDKGCTLIPKDVLFSLQFRSFAVLRMAGFFNWVKSWLKVA